jgi:hypothetical protein
VRIVEMSKTKSSWSGETPTTSKWSVTAVEALKRKDKLGELPSASDCMGRGSITAATKTPEISVVNMAGGLRLPMTTEKWCILFYDQGQWHFTDMDSQYRTENFLDLLVFVAGKMEVSDEDLIGKE